VTTDSRGRIKLGPVEKAVLSIVVGIISTAIPYLAWKVTDIGERLARVEGQLEARAYSDGGR
jgi:hypothetical protein